MPDLQTVSGAPQWIVWLFGLVAIAIAITVIVILIAIALGIYRDAASRGAPAIPWLIAGIIGGWITGLIWLVVRERYLASEIELCEQHTSTRPESSPQPEGPKSL